ncbi:hypothetical protein QOZ80_4AG0321730 [Eleusine coracana subsp. coracana]|nr:hypothetical protein QOZ80_4AG0321730 [Eleusine coracana subsp. coracana]
MKQQDPIRGSRRGRVSSLSPSSAAACTRVTSRAPPPAMNPAPGVTRTTTTTMAAARRLQHAAVPMPVPMRKGSTNESVKQDEKIEEEVVRLRGEVEALQKEVQRLLQLNADLQKGLSKTTNSNDPSQQEQADNDAATNKPKPPTVPPPLPTKEIARVPARPPPPPPPPPPLRQKKHQGPLIPVNKATAVRDTCSSLLTNKPHQHGGKGRHHHSDFVWELQNRSMHILSIKADVETKAEFINDLIKKVHTSSFADAEQVLAFVDWLDQQLSTLSDETAVLKHFKWPERKADALREAASEYRHLKHLLTEISSLNDDDGSTCEAMLRKISGLLAKLEKNMNRLVNLRSTVMPSYKELRIPTDWMLDSGMALKMRLASLNLAKKYMKKVLKELDNKETAANEAYSLLVQSVRFTYEVHEFAGGLDCEAKHSFEEVKRRIQMVSSP